MKYITFYLKIIYDSVAAGAGFGMFITLSILFLVNDINYTDEVKILAAIISFILIISGLVLSIILRINNKNIFATKKTFWISAKNISFSLTLISGLTFYYLWILNDDSVFLLPLILTSSFFSILAIYCNSKIYLFKSFYLFVTSTYILNSIIAGSLILFLVLYYYKIENYTLNNLLVIILPTMIFIKLLDWYLISSKKKNIGKNNIVYSKILALRGSCLILAYIVPLYSLIQSKSLVLNNDVFFIYFLISNLLAISGIFLERWLFFIESNKTIDTL